MHLLTITTFLFVSTLTFLSSSFIHGDAADPLFNFCPSPANYTPNSIFRQNLDTVLKTLSAKTPSSGFSTSVIGKKTDRIYGLAMCRGDVGVDDCTSCMNEAVPKLQQVCPSQKQGILWYDYCMIKYSDIAFITTVDTNNKFYMWNTQDITKPDLFKKQLGKLMNDVSKQAAYSPKLFASGEIQFTDAVKIYGLAQCTRDLSAESCAFCLQKVIADIPSCCNGKEGGRVVTGSCNIRYEIYPFYKG